MSDCMQELNTKQMWKASYRQMFSTLIYFFFLIPYIPISGIGSVSYPIIGILFLYSLGSDTIIDKRAIVFLSIAIFIYIIKMMYPDSNVLLRYFKVYFGFLVFYIYFTNLTEYIEIDKLALFSSWCVIIEAVMVNTVLPPAMLGNYPVTNGMVTVGHATNFFGFFQRPYGFCANPSMTSTLLVSLYCMVESKKSRRFLLFAVFISFSTTGLTLLLLVIFYKSKRKNLIVIVMLSFIVLISSILSLVDSNVAYRFSPKYFTFIFYYFLHQFGASLMPESYSPWIGTNYMLNGEYVIFTDNGAAPFFFTNGGILSILFILTLFWPKSINTRFSILILFIGALHYPAIFTVPGQIVFALLLSGKTVVSTLDKHKKIVMI